MLFDSNIEHGILSHLLGSQDIPRDSEPYLNYLLASALGETLMPASDLDAPPAHTRLLVVTTPYPALDLTAPETSLDHDTAFSKAIYVSRLLFHFFFWHDVGSLVCNDSLS